MTVLSRSKNAASIGRDVRGWASGPGPVPLPALLPGQHVGELPGHHGLGVLRRAAPSAHGRQHQRPGRQQPRLGPAGQEQERGQQQRGEEDAGEHHVRHHLHRFPPFVDVTPPAYGVSHLPSQPLVPRARGGPVLFSCWSVKGGSGTSVVAASLALVLASSAPAGVLLLDAGGGGLPAVLGRPEPPAAGLAQWCEAGDEVPPGALGRLELDAAPGLRLVPYGIPERVPPTAADGHRLAVTLALADDPRPAVVDCGSTESPFATALAGAATTSL